MPENVTRPQNNHQRAQKVHFTYGIRSNPPRHGLLGGGPPRAGIENRTAAPGTACVMPAPHGGKIKAVEVESLVKRAAARPLPPGETHTLTCDSSPPGETPTLTCDCSPGWRSIAPGPKSRPASCSRGACHSPTIHTTARRSSKTAVKIHLERSYLLSLPLLRSKPSPVFSCGVSRDAPRSPLCTAPRLHLDAFDLVRALLLAPRCLLSD